MSLIRFPQRETIVGKLIDQFLKSQINYEDRMIHMLFVLNRWELKKEIEERLGSGQHVVLD